MYQKRVIKKIADFDAQHFSLEEHLSNIRSQIGSVDAVTAASEEKRFKLMARIQHVKAVRACVGALGNMACCPASVGESNYEHDWCRDGLMSG